MHCFFFFFKQKTAYEMRISDWSSDVCSSDLITNGANCAVASGTAGNALGANSFVNFVNNTINTAGIDVNGNGSVGPGQGDILPGAGLQIGRASCRERVCQYV